MRYISEDDYLKQIEALEKDRSDEAFVKAFDYFTNGGDFISLPSKHGRCVDIDRFEREENEEAIRQGNGPVRKSQAFIREDLLYQRLDDIPTFLEATE